MSNLIQHGTEWSIIIVLMLNQTMPFPTACSVECRRWSSGRTGAPRLRALSCKMLFRLAYAALQYSAVFSTWVPASAVAALSGRASLATAFGTEVGFNISGFHHVSVVAAAIMAAA